MCVVSVVEYLKSMSYMTNVIFSLTQLALNHGQPFTRHRHPLTSPSSSLKCENPEKFLATRLAPNFIGLACYWVCPQGNKPPFLHAV